MQRERGARSSDNKRFFYPVGFTPLVVPLSARVAHNINLSLVCLFFLIDVCLVCVFILYLEIGNRVATQAHVLYTRDKTKKKEKGRTDPAVFISYYNSINSVLPG